MRLCYKGLPRLFCPCHFTHKLCVRIHMCLTRGSRLQLSLQYYFIRTSHKAKSLTIIRSADSEDTWPMTLRLFSRILLMLTFHSLTMFLGSPGSVLCLLDQAKLMHVEARRLIGWSSRLRLPINVRLHRDGYLFYYLPVVFSILPNFNINLPAFYRSLKGFLWRKDMSLLLWEPHLALKVD